MPSNADLCIFPPLLPLANKTTIQIFSSKFLSRKLSFFCQKKIQDLIHVSFHVYLILWFFLNPIIHEFPSFHWMRYWVLFYSSINKRFVVAWRKDPAKCFKIYHIFGVQKKLDRIASILGEKTLGFTNERILSQNREYFYGSC